MVEEGPSVIQGGEDNPLYQIAREEGRLGKPVEDVVPSQYSIIGDLLSVCGLVFP